MAMWGPEPVLVDLPSTEALPFPVRETVVLGTLGVGLQSAVRAAPASYTGFSSENILALFVNIQYFIGFGKAETIATQKRTAKIVFKTNCILSGAVFLIIPG